MASIAPSGGPGPASSPGGGSGPGKGRSQSPERAGAAPAGRPAPPLGLRGHHAGPAAAPPSSRPAALTRPSLVVVGGNAEGSLHWRDQMAGSLDAEAGE